MSNIAKRCPYIDGGAICCKPIIIIDIGENRGYSFKFMSLQGKDNFKLPYVSFLPFRTYKRLHKFECEEFLTILFSCLIFVFLCIAGIIINKQPYTWLGALAFSCIFGYFAGVLFYNLVTLFTRGNLNINLELPGMVGIAAGIICLFNTCSVNNPLHTPFNNTNSSNYPSVIVQKSHDYDDVTIDITEYGECYHSTPDCPSLSRSGYIYESPKNQAKITHRPGQRCN